MPRRDGIKRELVGSTAPAAASLPLTGAEVLHAVRGTQSFVVTAADIAALGGGGGGGGTPSDTAPASLGATAAAGTSTAYSRGDHVHPRPTAVQIGAAPLSPPVINITDTASPFTLLSSHAGQVIRVDTSAGPVEIIANASLYDATSGAAFVVDIEHVAGSSLSITGSGGLTLTSTGSATGVPALFISVPVFGRLVVSSATRAYFASELVTYESLSVIASTPVLNIDWTNSPFTILPGHANSIIRVDASTDLVELFADASLYDATNNRAFSCIVDVADATNGVEISTTGGLSFANLSSPFSNSNFDGVNYLEITSSTSATFFGTGTVASLVADLVVPLSSDISVVRAVSDNGLYPNVQIATTASRPLTVADAGDIIVSNGASNAITYTIPSSIFGSGGAGRALVCQIKVASVAGGALTFVGSGGVVLSYYGRNPGVTPYAAGDYLTVVLDSPTTASIFCTSPA